VRLIRATWTWVCCLSLLGFDSQFTLECERDLFEGSDEDGDIPMEDSSSAEEEECGESDEDRSNMGSVDATDG